MGRVGGVGQVWGGGVRVDGNGELKSFVKIQKKKIGGCEWRSEASVKIKKKKNFFFFGGGGMGVGSGGGGGVGLGSGWMGGELKLL